MRPPSTLLKISVRAYRWLVRLYPAAFRKRFAANMAETFSDLAEDVAEQRGSLGLIVIWVRAVLELLRTAIQQHLIETGRRFSMFANTSRRARVCWAMVACLVIAMFVTPADPFSQLLVGLPLFGLYLALSAWKKRYAARLSERA